MLTPSFGTPLMLTRILPPTYVAVLHEQPRLLENKANYTAPSSRCYFQPVSAKTSRSNGEATTEFLRGLARRIAWVRHEPSEIEWLFRRFSLVMLHRNAAAVRLDRMDLRLCFSSDPLYLLLILLLAFIISQYDHFTRHYCIVMVYAMMFQYCSLPGFYHSLVIAKAFMPKRAKFHKNKMPAASIVLSKVTLKFPQPKPNSLALSQAYTFVTLRTFGSLLAHFLKISKTCW